MRVKGMLQRDMRAFSRLAGLIANWKVDEG